MMVWPVKSFVGTGMETRSWEYRKEVNQVILLRDLENRIDEGDVDDEGNAFCDLPWSVILCSYVSMSPVVGLTERCGAAGKGAYYCNSSIGMSDLKSWLLVS